MSDIVAFIEEQDEIRDRRNQAWARWLARSFDVLVMVPVGIVLYIPLYLSMETLTGPTQEWLQTPIVAAIIETLAMLVLILVVEPIFVSAAGATPGKWIMGIRVRKPDGRRLGYFSALARTGSAMTFGLALGIPLLQFVAAVLGRAQLLTNGYTIWDKQTNARILHRRRNVFVWSAMLVLVICCNVALGVLSRME